MDQLINNINRLEQTPGNRKAEVLDCCFWPEAEDRALRGRNLSAVWSLQTAEEPGLFIIRCSALFFVPFCWSSHKAINPTFLLSYAG